MLARYEEYTVRNGCWLWVALVGLVSCSKAPAPAPLEAPEVAAPTTLDEVMRRTHFAFWPEGEAFTGGHTTYLARVDARGLSLQGPAEAAASLRLGLATLGREGREALPVGALRRRVDGVLLREGAGVTEVLENTEAGLEQSWRFAAAPGGEGDLLVRVPVLAGGVGVPTEAGLRFTVAGAAFTYGHGTWVDAAGVRTDVPARFDGDGVVLRVPADLLARSGYPAVLDPLISPEQDVDAAVSHPAFGSQDYPAIVSNGSTFLVVWQDNRVSGGVMATRVAFDGSVLEPWGLFLGSSQNSSYRPAVASDGTDFLVVTATAGGLRAVRVSGGGALLDPAPLVVSTDFASQAALAWSGTQYVLVTIELRYAPVESHNVVARTLSPGGVVTSTASITNNTSVADGVPAQPRLAVGSTMLLVVYVENGQTRARRLAFDLAPLDLAPLLVASSAGAFDVAWDGQRFVVTRVATDLLATRVSTSGVVIDPAPLRLTSGVTVGMHAAVAEPGGVRVAWGQTAASATSLHTARIAPTGALYNLGVPPVASGLASAANLALARGGPDFLAAWRGATTGDLYGLRVGADHSALDPSPRVLSSSPARQGQPTLVWNGAHYLAAWVDARGPQVAVYATRLSRDGTPLSPVASQVSGSAPSVTRPAVASDGRGWLVTWSQPFLNASDIRAVRVEPTGEALDDGGLLLVGDPGEQAQPAVAWLGDQYLVAYHDRPAVPNVGYDVRGVLVGADGARRSDAGLALGAAPSDQMFPRVGASASGALVVWSDLRDGGSNIIGTRIGTGGQPLDPDGLVISSAPGAQGDPDVAAAGDGFVVCWMDRNFAPAETRVARVRLADGLLDDAGLRLSRGGESQPCAAAWDGEQFFVAWPERAGPSTVFTLTGAWLAFDGGLVSDGGLVLTPQPQGGVSERLVSLGSPGHRQLLVGFTSENLADAGFVSRARTRVLTRGVAPVATPAMASTPEDTAVTVPLSATDADGDAVRFVVVRAPASGVATPVDGGVRYQPLPDFNGPDLFLVVADDGALNSTPVQVDVSVTPVEDAPVSAALTLELDEDDSATVPVPARDVDGQPLTFSVRQAAAHGTLAGQPPSVVYTPAADFSGADEFTYVVSDGQGTSAPARVAVTVRPLADAPLAVSATVTTPEDTPVDLVLAATDADGDGLSYEVLEGPTRGVLSGDAPALRYAPGADFAGEDRVVFRASDGTATSTATVRLVVTPVNDPPTATDLTFEARAGVPQEFSLQGADPEGAPVSFRVLDGPSQGSLSGEAPTLTYTASATFEGEDSLRFEVADGEGAVAVGAVRFVVTREVPQASSCACGSTGVELLVGLAALALRRRRH